MLEPAIRVKIFLLVYCFFLSEKWCVAEYEPHQLDIRIERQIQNQGFHRYLTTEILINLLNSERVVDDWQNFTRTVNECSWLLVENFDTNAYVDVYELKLKNYEQNYTFLLSNKVNTETAEYRSLKFKLFIYINRQIINCVESNNQTNSTHFFCRIFFKLPIHVRYHAPTDSPDNQSYNFTVKRPRLFVTNCSLNSIQEKWSAHNPATTVEERPDNFDLEKMIELPCDRDKKSFNDYLTFITRNRSNTSVQPSQRICLWNELEYHMMHKTDFLLVQVPVGIQDYGVIILIVTLVVLTFLAFSVAKCVRKKIRKVSCRINQDKNDEEEDEDYEEKERFASKKVRQN